MRVRVNVSVRGASLISKTINGIISSNIYILQNAASYTTMERGAHNVF
jgi:hypothetical protein